MNNIKEKKELNTNKKTLKELNKTNSTQNNNIKNIAGKKETSNELAHSLVNNNDGIEEKTNTIQYPSNTHKTQTKHKFKSFIKQEYIETKLLLKSVPSPIIVMFTLSVVLMNLFANKSINTGLNWLALDCGIILSWASFLSMDIIVKRFGGKAGTKISIIVLLVNLFISFVFFIVAKISGLWGESFIEVGGDIANTALNNTFSGSWFVILGSSVAFLVSAIVNNVLNVLIGKCFKNKDFVEYAARSYISTIIGQFVDNLIFALIVSLNFFGWSLLQCVTCAITGAMVELLCEIVFSPLGFRVCKIWDKEQVGKEYLDFCNNKNNLNEN